MWSAVLLAFDHPASAQDQSLTPLVEHLGRTGADLVAVDRTIKTQSDERRPQLPCVARQTPWQAARLVIGGRQKIPGDGRGILRAPLAGLLELAWDLERGIVGRRPEKLDRQAQSHARGLEHTAEIQRRTGFRHVVVLAAGDVARIVGALDY